MENDGRTFLKVAKMWLEIRKRSCDDNSSHYDCLNEE